MISVESSRERESIFGVALKRIQSTHTEQSEIIWNAMRLQVWVAMIDDGFEFSPLWLVLKLAWFHWLNDVNVQ